MAERGVMHAGNLETSERLQSVFALLSDGKEHTTRDIIDNSLATAVSAAISELRDNGCIIHCRQEGNAGKRIAYYRMDVKRYLPA